MPVRDATVSDVEEICALIEEHAVYEGKHDLKHDRAKMARHLFGDDPKAWVVLAYPEGEPETVAGFVFCSWNFSTWEGEPGIWMDDLYLRPEYRGHGLARELMADLRARTEGRIVWEMQHGNDTAAAFYTRLGAVPVNDWTLYRWQP